MGLLYTESIMHYILIGITYIRNVRFNNEWGTSIDYNEIYYVVYTVSTSLKVI